MIGSEMRDNLSRDLLAEVAQNPTFLIWIRNVAKVVWGFVVVFCVVTLVAFGGGGGVEASLQGNSGQQEEAGLPRKYTQEATEAAQEAALPAGAIPVGLAILA